MGQVTPRVVGRVRRVTAVLCATVLACAVLAACSGDDEDASDTLTMWVVEDLPDRVRAIERITDAFTRESGVEVEVVPVAEDQFSQLLVSSAAAGDLPDVMGGLPLAQVRSLDADRLIDTRSAAAVVDELDRSTFLPRALELTSDGDRQLSVPSDAWAQLLYYRRDLFEKAGLAPPTTYARVLEAARTLDSRDVAGFVGATAPGDAFTEQTFQQIALGNDCQLLDDDGDVAIGSRACERAYSFYGRLVDDYSVPGAQDVDTTRAAYFAGQAAMFVWSSFVLDEMAGLRADARPTCPQCEEDPAFLARNSGVVTSVQGPDGDGPATFGEITSWTITRGAATGPSRDLVRYMLDEGYLPWIEIAPEGKVPVRQGTPEQPRAFTDRWDRLPVGLETKAPLSDFYPAEVIQALADGPATFSRWGLEQPGGGRLLGAIQGEQPVADAVNDLSNGDAAAEVARACAETVTAIQESQ